MTPIRRFLALGLVSALFCGWAAAAEPEFTIVIRNHRFEPAEVKVPSGQRIKLVVDNQDSTPEEFESHSLNREKVVPGGKKASIYVGPLKPGRYAFFGEYNEKTAQGVLVAE
ncbi:MAG TPA: cupredoxin domain-containing protein [Ramlibacter sp.]|uniref:cupredoxin domain-containing protein n=1 Tax=Ramlibacter sp. TaxID=1917967 RepID=UPI002ED08554